MAISHQLAAGGGISPSLIGRETAAVAAKLRNFAVVKLNFMICKLKLAEFKLIQEAQAFEAVYMSALLMQEQPGEIN